MFVLAKVENNFRRRAGRFLTVIATADAYRANDHEARQYRDMTVGHVVVELQSSLGYVARSAVLAGMLGGKTSSGTCLTVVAGRASKTDVLRDAAHAAKPGGRVGNKIPGRDEPAWHSAHHLGRVVGALKPSNANAITASLGLFPEARRALTAVRNFYAHRGEHTLLEIRDVLRTEYAEVLAGHPTDELFRLPARQRGSLLERWVWNYFDIVRVMCSD